MKVRPTKRGRTVRAHEGTHRAPERAEGRVPIVLVVDDFGSAREIYARVLTSSGFKVLEASNGAEALEKGASQRPDLIVMDLAMPGMDGLEAIRRFKSDARTLTSQIVVVTGAAYADGSRKAREAGCDAYLVKPCLPETLLTVARRLLDAGRAAAPSPGRTAPDPPSSRR